MTAGHSAVKHDQRKNSPWVEVPSLIRMVAELSYCVIKSDCYAVQPTFIACKLLTHYVAASCAIKVAISSWRLCCTRPRLTRLMNHAWRCKPIHQVPTDFKRLLVATMASSRQSVCVHTRVYACESCGTPELLSQHANA